MLLLAASSGDSASNGCPLPDESEILFIHSDPVETSLGLVALRE